MRYIGAVLALLLIGVAMLGCTSPPNTSIHNTSLTSITWCDDPATLAIIGDSGSASYQPVGAPSDEAVAPGEFWQEHLAALLAYQRGTTTYTHAHSGAMAKDYLPGGLYPNDLDALVTEQPSLVLIELGGNEWFSGQRTAAQAKSDLQALLDKVKLLSPRSTVGFIGIWQLLATPAHTTPWFDYRRAIFEVAADNHWPFFDLYPYFLATGQPDRFKLVSSVDLIHLTRNGHQLMYSVMHQGVNRGLCGWS